MQGCRVAAVAGDQVWQGVCMSMVGYGWMMVMVPCMVLSSVNRCSMYMVWYVCIWSIHAHSAVGSCRSEALGRLAVLVVNINMNSEVFRGIYATAGVV